MAPSGRCVLRVHCYLLHSHLLDRAPRHKRSALASDLPCCVRAGVQGSSNPVKATRGVESTSELKARGTASSCKGAEIAPGAGGGSSRPERSARAKPSPEPAASGENIDFVSFLF